MASISQLYVELALRADGFNNQIRAAQREAREFEKTVKPMTQVLKDMGDAMNRVGVAASISLTAPIVAAGAFAVKNFSESAEAARILENSIRSTGGAANRTADQLKAMASELQKNSLFGDDQIIREVTNQLLTFTNISGDAFDRTQKAALDLATMLGGDLQSSTIMLGKALNDPVANLGALGRAGIQFSAEQKTVIKALSEGGRLAEAQSIILKELERQYGGTAAAAAAAGTGPMTQLWNRIGDLTERWGELIVKAMLPFVDMIGTVVGWLEKTDDTTKIVVLSIAALTAAIGPALLVLGTMANSVSNLIVMYARLAPVITSTVIPAITGFATSLKALVISGGPLILTAAAITALGVALYKLVSAWRENIEAQGRLKVALADQETATIRAAQSLKDKYGIEIKRGTDSTAEWGRKLAEAAETAAWFERQARGVAEAQKAVVQTTGAATRATAQNITVGDQSIAKTAEWGYELSRIGVMTRDLSEIALPQLSLAVENIPAPPDSINQELLKIASTLDAIETFQQAGLLADKERFMNLKDVSRQAAEQAKKDTDAQAKAYDTLYRSVKDTASRTFLEIFRDGEFRFKALGDTIKGMFATLANQILSTMVAKLITPLVERITGALSGILGKIPGFGGILGTGAAGAGTATAGGTAAAGAGGLGAFMTNPWTIGIGAALAGAAAWVKSQAHHEANTFVQEFQNPFGDALRNIVDAFHAANASGNLTIDAAGEARRQVVALWDQFKSSANAFARRGSDEFTVVRQAFATMTTHFGSDLSRLLGDMDTVIASIERPVAQIATVAAVADTTTIAVDNFAASLESLRAAAEAAQRQNAIEATTQNIVNPGWTQSGNTVSFGATQYAQNTPYGTRTLTTANNLDGPVAPAGSNVRRIAQPTTIIMQVAGREMARAVIADINDLTQYGGERLIATEVAR